MTSRERSDIPVTMILVRHARPDVLAAMPAASWELSPDGWDAARALGVGLRRFGPLRIVTSDEVKAIQTGEAIRADDATTDARFGEQGCGTVPFLPDGAFRERVLEHFRHADARMLGDESSAEAALRFDTAVQDVLKSANAKTPVIVSHGRIISAWLATFAGPAHGPTSAAEEIWMSLRMPDAFLLRRDGSGWTHVRFDGEIGAGS